MPIISTLASASANGYGFSGGPFRLAISSNQTDLNLNSFLISSGWNGAAEVIVTINSGVYISSTSTSNAALTISGSFPSGVSVTNNGTIVGMGGAGGHGGGTGYYQYWFTDAPTSGGAGGLALSVSSAVTFTNNGTIAGGGGGGGGGCAAFETAIPGAGGGGGQSSYSTNSVGGRIGLVGVTPAAYSTAGTNGTYSAAGTGGTGGYIGGYCCGAYFWQQAGSAGNGGTWANSGGAGGQMSSSYGTSYYQSPGSGGSAGGAVTGNSNITWISTGTRYGSIT